MNDLETKYILQRYWKLTYLSNHEGYTCVTELATAIEVGVENNDRSSFSFQLVLTRLLELVAEELKNVKETT